MNLSAAPLSLASLGLARPTPCCAVITPTRSSDIWSQVRRLAEGLREEWRAQMSRRHAADDAMPIDAATLRDLGVSHAATLRERVDPLAGRRQPHPWS